MKRAYFISFLATAVDGKTANGNAIFVEEDKLTPPVINSLISKAGQNIRENVYQMADLPFTVNILNIIPLDREEPSKESPGS